jgi:cytochrome P450
MEATMLSLDIKPTLKERLVNRPFKPSQFTNLGPIAERSSQRAIEASKSALAKVARTSIELTAFVMVELAAFVILLAAFGFLAVVLFCVAEAGEGI